MSDPSLYPGLTQKSGLRYPTAMVWNGHDLYVATTQEIRIYTDSHAIGHADTSRTFARGWPWTWHTLDWTFGLRFGPDGYPVHDSQQRLSQPITRRRIPGGLRGALLRISPDGKSIERYAYGLRFAYGLAFNAAGDLFSPITKGAGTTRRNQLCGAWRKLRARPKLADAPAIGPLLAIEPHLSTNGIDFNSPANDFGGAPAICSSLRGDKTASGTRGVCAGGSRSNRWILRGNLVVLCRRTAQVDRCAIRPERRSISRAIRDRRPRPHAQPRSRTARGYLPVRLCPVAFPRAILPL